MSPDERIDNEVEVSEKDITNTYCAATEDEIKVIVSIVEHIVKNLVDDVDAIKIAWENQERHTYVTLSVAQDDMGKVIGKQGRIAKAIRAIVKSAAIKQGKRYVLDIK